MTRRALIDDLRRAPHRFETAQAARILEAWTRQRPTGDAARLELRGSFSLAFPTWDVESVKAPPTGRPTLTVSGFGVGGAVGPLPVRYTEFVNEAVRRGETAARDFLDIFNGRLLDNALHLQRLYRPALQDGPPQASNLGGQLEALLGFGTRGLADAAPELAARLLPLAALVRQRPVSAHALERVLGGILEAPVQVRPFDGAWLEIAREDRTRLGPDGRNARLGAGAALGCRAWDPAAGIELAVGPLSLRAATDLLPGTAAHNLLAGVVETLIGRDLTVTIRLLVAPEAAQAARLERRPRLGWTAWLGAPRRPSAGTHPRFRLRPYRRDPRPRRERTAS